MQKFRAYKTQPTIQNILKYHKEIRQLKAKEWLKCKEDFGYIAETQQKTRKKLQLKNYKKSNKIKMKFNSGNHFHRWWMWPIKMIQSTYRQRNKTKVIFFKICNKAFWMKINQKEIKIMKKKNKFIRKDLWFTKISK